MDKQNTLQKEKVLLSWVGPERPQKKQNKKFYRDMISLGLIICGLLLVAGQWVLIICLLSLLFAYYALNSVKPLDTDYSITDKCIKIGQDSYKWYNLSNFFESKELDDEVISIDKKEGIFKRIFLVPDNEQTKVEAIKIISDYLPKKDHNITNNSSNSRIQSTTKSRFLEYADKLGLKI